jgi:hypothetical protein
MAAKFTPEQLQALHEAQTLAHKIHTELVVPSNASLDVRMNAISVLAAELAVTNTDNMQLARKVIDTIASTAKSMLQSGFDYKAQRHKTQ